MNALSERCAGLQHLILTGLRSVSDVGLRYLSTSCKDLRTLDLSLVYLVSDGAKRDFGLEGLPAIALKCHRKSSKGCIVAHNYDFVNQA